MAQQGDLDDIKAEMIRKPDAHLALEWIAKWAVTAEDAHQVAEAYLEGLENE